MHPSGTELADLAELIDASRLEVVIDRIFPFEEIASALAHVEEGHAKGKVVVQLSPP
jgi:alcohol dehydrogenase